MSDITLSVPDIHCGHCKTSIEGAVGAVEGVASVEVAIEEHSVDVAYDGGERTFQQIVAAIEAQGYVVV
jgi:copper chaperone